IAIVNAYHPTDDPDTQDIQFDPRVQKLELIPIIGYISSPNGMWGLYVQNFLRDQPSTPLGENRTPEEILRIANQIACPIEVPNEYYQGLFDDLED
ncbi:MAG: hypothetical protein IIA70_02405, partial [Proteobacteria bacterium]|nr:hypothetical protein [Pseudomonadota bacterium]